MSNKLRLIKIYELRGKIHPIEQLVIDILDGIEKISSEQYIDYFKDGKIYFTFYLNTKNIVFLYSDFKTKFGCSFEETKEVMKYLLEKHLNLIINIVV